MGEQGGGAGGDHSGAFSDLVRCLWVWHHINDPLCRRDHFVFNDKCAAGTGRFFETLARILHLEIAKLSEKGRNTDPSVKITSTCVVFAENEIINLLARGFDSEKIIDITDANSQLQAQLKNAKVKMWIDVYNILNDDQKEKWTGFFERMIYDDKMRNRNGRRMMGRQKMKAGMDQ